MSLDIHHFIYFNDARLRRRDTAGTGGLGSPFKGPDLEGTVRIEWTSEPLSNAGAVKDIGERRITLVWPLLTQGIRCHRKKWLELVFWRTARIWAAVEDLGGYRRVLVRSLLTTTLQVV